MTDPLVWLAISTLLVAASLTAVLVAALPALQELGRAARSAEKLFDTLHREFPPTLEAIRLTGMEISELTDDLNEGVKSAADAMKYVDRGLSRASQEAGRLHLGTRRVTTGIRAAWQAWNRPSPRRGASRERLAPPRPGERG